MVTDWSNGDDQGIAALMNDGLGDSPELERVMLTDRNARWAGWIAERMKQPGTVFVAVGAGHLAGENSVRTDPAKHPPTAMRLAYCKGRPGPRPPPTHPPPLPPPAPPPH